MNNVKVSLGGKDYPLLFNGRAMFAIRETYETESEMLESISEQSVKGFGALCEVVHVLAEQGELVQRYEGYDPQEVLTAEQVGLVASPLDAIGLRNAVLKSVVRGFGREVEEVEKDLGLAELEQKKTAR